MVAAIWKLAIAFAFSFGVVVSRAGLSPQSCRRLSAGEAILVQPETCSLLDVLPAGMEFMGVVEGDENALQRAANIVFTNRDQYVAVFFHASWCPFSKNSIPNFNSMASFFPSIPHFTFEESAIRPSILSRYRIHGFPTIFLVHSSARMRYHGSRSIASLTAFYTNVTGIKPSSVDRTTVKKHMHVINLTSEHNSEQENCPFTWARSPEKLLRQDTCLALACLFVMLRILHFLLPKLTGLWDYSQSILIRARPGFGRLNPSKGRTIRIDRRAALTGERR